MREALRARDPNAEPETAVIKAERRKHPRARIALRGRYLLADRREYLCTIVDASAGAVALAAPERGQVGEQVVVYFDTIGRVEGEVVRHLDEGFVIKLTGRSRAGDALAELVARHYREAPMSQADRPLKS